MSAGNTGATMAAALLLLGRLPGVSRPAITSPMPTRKGTSIILVQAPMWIAAPPAFGPIRHHGLPLRLNGLGGDN